MSQSGPLVRHGAEVIRVTFERFRRRFELITQRARRHFEERDLAGSHLDAAKRLVLYRRVLDEILRDLAHTLGPSLEDRETWRSMKAEYASAIAGFADEELAETFYNSVTRRIFATVGVDPTIEFVDRGYHRAAARRGFRVHRTFVLRDEISRLVVDLMRHFRFFSAFRDAERDAAMVAERIETAWSDAGHTAPIQAVDVIETVFYRGSAAYLVGRIRNGSDQLPLALVLINSERGVEVDAVLLSAGELSIVFSFTRSYFHAQIAHPSDVVSFLSSLVPQKPIAELYICLGFNKHGKTELYRALLAHLEGGEERFDFAPGEHGMVMIVFDLEGFDYVFKVIRDRFDYPKTTTREDVMQRYSLVFQRDRAGRLVDAQEYEHLTFSCDRFAPELLEHLASAAAASVTIEGDEVTIRHLYVERRVRPLNLYLREVDDEHAGAAIVDYGFAIRDLARTNIFPGDLLLKNFGVTRHGRVIFYDYDELCLVTDCRFRDMPVARDVDEEMAGESWFYVGENDIFPEEFIRFLGLTEFQRETFLATHAEVLTAAFWRDLQRRHEEGEAMDVFPYQPWKRLRHGIETRAEATR